MDRWEYLTTKEYGVRHHIAEYYMENMPVVIDVGTYRKKLNVSGQLNSIDPLKTLNGTFHGSVHEWYLLNKNFIDNAKFGLVILGLHIEGDSSEFDTVVMLAKKADVCVIEVPAGHDPSWVQFNNLLTNSGKRINTEMILLLPEVETPGFPPFSRRYIYVLKGDADGK